MVGVRSDQKDNKEKRWRGGRSALVLDCRGLNYCGENPQAFEREYARLTKPSTQAREFSKRRGWLRLFTWPDARRIAIPCFWLAARWETSLLGFNTFCLGGAAYLLYQARSCLRSFSSSTSFVMICRIPRKPTELDTFNTSSPVYRVR